MSRDIKFEFIYKGYGEFISIVVSLDNILDMVCPTDDIFELATEEIERYEDYELVGKRQYTGLKDKNGIDIYEGDILKYSNGMEITSVIEFRKGCFYSCLDFELMTYTLETIFDSSCVTDIEVIGNIYEDKDLLN